MEWGTLARAAAYGAWRIARLPIYILLVILEPVATYGLGGLAIVGVTMSLFFKLYGVPGFPFWLMLSISLGFGILAALYQSLLELFA
jgi:hypothetical protein